MTKIIKLLIPAGKATPVPPVGPALGQHGVNIAEFCRSFNERTAGEKGVIKTTVTVKDDRSFTFKTYGRTTSDLIREASDDGLLNEDSIGVIAALQGVAPASVRGTAKSMGLL